MIDLTKPIEAVQIKTGQIVPVTVDRTWDGRYYDKGDFRTNECPNTSETNQEWHPDGSDYCGKNLWKIRNVAVKTKDFSVDNPGLHKLYTGYALETLEVLDRAIEEFDSHSRVDSSILCGVLMRERAKLVANDKAYQDAAVIRYVGQDWLDEVGKES
jgi:hypothetical protein